MSHQASIPRPSVAAIAVGAIFLVALGLMRARIQAFVDTLPFLAIALSALVFLVPGIVTGAIGSRAAFINGVILGLIGAAVVTLSSPRNFGALIGRQLWFMKRSAYGHVSACRSVYWELQLAAV